MCVIKLVCLLVAFSHGYNWIELLIKYVGRVCSDRDYANDGIEIDSLHRHLYDLRQAYDDHCVMKILLINYLYFRAWVLYDILNY